MNEINNDNKNDQDGSLEMNMITIKTEVSENQSKSSRNSFSAILTENDES